MDQVLILLRFGDERANGISQREFIDVGYIQRAYRAEYLRTPPLDLQNPKTASRQKDARRFAFARDDKSHSAQALSRLPMEE